MAAERAVRPNVRTVQQVYEAFRTRDEAQIFSLFSPDIEIVQSTEVPWGGRFSGHAGARDFFAKLTGMINSTLSLESFIDAGTHVVALGRTQGTVNETGARYDVPLSHVWEIENGKVKRVQFLIDTPTMTAALAEAKKA